VAEAAPWEGRALGLRALLEGRRALRPLGGSKCPFGGLLGP